MKILVTGGSGMVGKNLLEYLKNTSHTVFAPNRNELNLLESENKIKCYLVDNQIDFVIHCAGYVGGIQANIDDPFEFLHQNLIIGQNLINASYQVGIKKLLNLGSSCMYPKEVENPIKENSILTGRLEPTNEGYALAKIVTYKLCEYIYHNNNNFLYKTFIPCNLYGKWDKFDINRSHMIPSAIKKIHFAKVAGLSTVEIWGNGNARREFMYAGDLAKIIIKSIEIFDDLPNVLNIGLGYDYTVLEYYQAVAALIYPEVGFHFDKAKPVGMIRKLVDNAKQKALNLDASTSLHDGLELTYTFYLENLIND